MSTFTHLQKFGRDITTAVVGYFESGAPFVLLGLGGQNHYLCEQNGTVTFEKGPIIARMMGYITEDEAIRLFEKHAKQMSSRPPNQALVSGFYYRNDTDPSGN